MKIMCLGNYPPRQCGIATFTENLVRSILNAAEIHSIEIELEVIAMNDEGKTYSYPPIVKNTIRANEKSNYIQMANIINNSGAELFLLQHEYGIYGGESGVLLLSLLRRIKIPIVSTFHTVLEKPSFHQYEVLRKIAAYSNKMVIMNSLAINFLTEIYHIRRAKIACIEHGVPDFKVLKDQDQVLPLNWQDKKIMLTFGLIGRSKGIETVIRALPAIVSNHPNVLYVVLGKTHPHVVQNAGEEYREYLISMVKRLKLSEHVLFINEYVSEIALMAYLKRADIYVTPYLNKAQITSGTLSYAVSGGCAVVSTPYWHAEQLLADGRGILFDFGNFAQLAEVVNNLLDHPKSMQVLQQKAFEYGKTISWPLIGKSYLNEFESVINQTQEAADLMKQDHKIHYPEFDISHLKRLSDDTGLLQHARTSVPYYKAGYCLDDNSRAIVVCVKAWNRDPKQEYLDLLDKYLAYLTYMQRRDGSFTNYMTYERTLLDTKSDDAYGRIIWALGYLIRFAPTNSYFHLAFDLFERAIPQYGKLSYARGYANCIFGLYHYIKRFPDQERYLQLLQTLSDQLCEIYKRHKKENWNWFEDSLTYDNGLLPAALYRSYEISGEEKYLQIADESRIFLESKCFREEWLSLIGNRKWLRLDQDYDFFAQQPIDAMAMVILYQSAWEATRNKEYLDKLRLSFDWFFGKNDLDITLFDFESKGCNDGIEEANINRNQGAESNIAFLLSYLVADSIFSLKS
ncbi:MAG: glycosyltransferase [Prolixibacteraceae bacterium]